VAEKNIVKTRKDKKVKYKKYEIPQGKSNGQKLTLKQTIKEPMGLLGVKKIGEKTQDCQLEKRKNR